MLRPGKTLEAPGQGSWSEGAVGLTQLGDGLGALAAGKVGGMRAKNEGRRGWRAAMQDDEEPPKRRAHEVDIESWVPSHAKQASGSGGEREGALVAADAQRDELVSLEGMKRRSSGARPWFYSQLPTAARQNGVERSARLAKRSTEHSPSGATMTSTGLRR
ncbi:hypothetical protein PSPO01_07687 [Paraphaeosphaeria sporulosa]